jgi:outer membrane protein insertion porin family
MGPGQVFTPDGLRRDREGIQDFYGARGYIDARIIPGLRPNTVQGTMDIVYRITEGKPSHIELIEIKGNTKTKDRVIRRELAVSPGELFDMVKVKLSTNRLYGLQFFSRVDAQAEDTDVPHRKNLVLTVEEKNTGNVRFGAGFSSIDELVGFAELTQGNADIFKSPLFFGTGAGQKLRLVAQVGTARRDIQLNFIEPWFTGRKLALGVDLSLFVSPGGYILGEETALIEALEGKRGEPRNKPPYPTNHGVHGKPTLMNNVETFSFVPCILP